MTSDNPFPESPNQVEHATEPKMQVEPEMSSPVEHSAPPPLPANCRITLQREKNWWDKWKPLVEIGGVILLSVYTGYTIKIYKANNDAANAAHGTLTQIQQQTALMQQQVEAALAAIITKQFRVAWPEQAYVSIILDNKGKVIASDIHADFHLTEVSLRDQRTIGNALPNWAFTIPEIAPSLDLPLERGTYLNIPQEEFKQHPMQEAIMLTGTFTYFNGFRKKTDPVCYYILGTVEFKNKMGAVQQSTGPSVLKCDELSAQVAWYLQIQRDIGAK